MSSIDGDVVTTVRFVNKSKLVNFAVNFALQKSPVSAQQILPCLCRYLVLKSRTTYHYAPGLGSGVVRPKPVSKCLR